MAESKSSYFLSTLLGSSVGSIPKGSQWAVFFENIESVFPAIALAYKGEPHANSWRTKEAAASIMNDSFHTKDGVGCLFCQAIKIPGEGSTPIAEGIKYNSYIRSHVGAGRNDFPILNMAFLETNVSFADTILRGWALATAKFGMISRTGTNKNYRTNMWCYKYTASPNGHQVLLKAYFAGICCISVDDQEYNYDHSTIAVKRQAQFVYHDYYIDAVTGNNIIGSVPRTSTPI